MQKILIYGAGVDSGWLLDGILRNFLCSFNY